MRALLNAWSWSCFNPHPSRRTGATSRLVALTAMRLVSILTRPGGRVQLPVRHNRIPQRPGFNPHPSRRTGATSASACARASRSVSILTRPGGRVQLRSPAWWHALAIVSILTRPGGRVQPCAFTSVLSDYFVSILTRPGGRVQRTREKAQALAFF